MVVQKERNRKLFDFWGFCWSIKALRLLLHHKLKQCSAAVLALSCGTPGCLAHSTVLGIFLVVYSHTHKYSLQTGALNTEYGSIPYLPHEIAAFSAWKGVRLHLVLRKCHANAFQEYLELPAHQPCGGGVILHPFFWSRLLCKVVWTFPWEGKSKKQCDSWV